MTVSECYAYLAGDYEDALRRLRNDDNIKKFLGMLSRDQNFSLLESSLERQDYDSAFRAVHTLKGITLNLSLSELSETAAALTEALRERQSNPDIFPLLTKLKASYQKMCTAVGSLQNDLGKAD